MKNPPSSKSPILKMLFEKYSTCIDAPHSFPFFHPNLFPAFDSDEDLGQVLQLLLLFEVEGLVLQLLLLLLWLPSVELDHVQPHGWFLAASLREPLMSSGTWPLVSTISHQGWR